MAFDLEKAENREGLRRVVIDPLTRVEGHGKVTILLDEARRVHEVRLHIVEFRGFERFIRGRPYWEVPVMVQRLCGICPVSHHLAASKALDAVVGARRVPATADKVRRLMHYGQMLQSHALHFFHLASPDLLFGFDSDPAQRNVAGLLAANPALARRGVMLRKFGQEVIRVTAGKRIHGTGSIPGGVNKSVSEAERAELTAPLADVIEWAKESVALVEDLFARRKEELGGFGAVRSSILSLVGRKGELDFYDGVLRARDADGAIIFDGVEPNEYRAHLKENVRSWSYMKFPFIASRGPEHGWYKVGPLARIQNCDSIPSPLAEEARMRFRSAAGGRLVHAPLAYHWARMIELLHAAEVIGDLLRDPDIGGSELTSSGPRATEGIGVFEAPRGTLIHHYEVDAQDLVIDCNLIVSTTHNNQAMHESIREVARRHLDGHEPTEGLLNRIEVAIRAYDPCLSCATHAVGGMPLEVTILDARGGLVRRLSRDAEACG